MSALFFGLVLLAYQQPTGPPIVVDDPKAEAPDAAMARARQAQAQYEARKAKTPDTADAQWHLALWCGQNGLTTEAAQHLGNVLRLDPSREAAWHKLGYKKHDGRWMTEAQIAEDTEQKKADRHWAPLLKRAHRTIHGGEGRSRAEVELDRITDPRAVPSIYREFGDGGPADQEIAIRLLGQVDSPLASKVLAVLAVYGKTPNVRRIATETLRQRPAEDFLEVLVGLMKDLLKFEVRPVGGPGSPGELFVEGERFNVRRFYTPPPAPDVSPRLGDTISFDDQGMPVITRPTGTTLGRLAIPGTRSYFEFKEIIQFSATQVMIETQRSTLAARSQMEDDVRQVEALNDVRRKFNDLLMGVARDATGKSLGETPQQWRDALALRSRYAPSPSKAPPRPTLTEIVPPAYQPTFGQLAFVTQVGITPGAS